MSLIQNTEGKIALMASLKPLKTPSFITTVRAVSKTITVVLSAVFGLSAFGLLVYGALQTPTAFAALVLRLALFMILLLSLLVVLNVIQRATGDRREMNDKRLRDELHGLVPRLSSASPAERRLLLEPYRDRIGLIVGTSKSFSGPDRHIVRDTLLDMGAQRPLEGRARTGRQKWQQVEALILLGWLRSPESLVVFDDALLDPDPDIGYAACHALSESPDASAYISLIGALRDGRLSRSRVAALMETSKYEGTLALLEKRVADPDAKVRLWIAYLLGRKRDPEAVPMLTVMTKDPDAGVRANAARSLGEIGGGSCPLLIKPLLVDEDWLVRARAAKAAGAIGSPALIDDLLPLLRDRHWWARQNTALALERIGRESTPGLERFLDDDDRFARNKAAEILGRLGVVNEKLDALTGPVPEAKRAKAFLVKIGRAEAVNIIENAAARADPAGQRALAGLLGDIGNPDSLRALASLAASDNVIVSKAAREAIDRIGEAA